MIAWPSPGRWASSSVPARSDMASRDRTRIWIVVVGAAIGLALGILVSVTTDVPLAPEGGLLLGALVAWFSTAAQ